MPRIPETNTRFRTKEQLCKDIATILSADLHYGTKHAVLSEVTWVWSEFNGKYKGCEHWSEEAWLLRDQPKRLVHEHIIPKKMLIEQLLQLSNPNAMSVKALLTRHCIGAVITREEDRRLSNSGLRSKMPEGWVWNENESDVWARYSLAGIKLRMPHP